MLQALRALGARVEHIEDWEDTGEPAVRITPLPVAEDGPGELPAVSIDCGLAGTVMRFLPPVAALTGRMVDFDGDPEARIRPMAAVLDGLSALGVRIEDPSAPDGGFPETLPFTVHAQGGVRGGEIAVDASGSSQFVSGLLLAAPLMPEGLTLRHTGAQVPSLEHVAMTVQVLREVGVVVDDSVAGRWRVSPGRPRAFTVRVEPDLSNAGPFLAAAAATGGEVSVPGWPVESTQIGRRWQQLLPQFGAEVVTTPETTAGSSGQTVTLTVRGARDEQGHPRVLSPGTVDGTAELTPTVAALAALAQEPTTFTSVAHLRGHETDRIAALVTELRRLGAEAEETQDGLRILSPVAQGATVHSYADHRMATFAAVIGLRQSGVEIEDIACTAKTMPTFPQLWSELVAQSAETH